jgi:hypothetical protein
MQKLACACKIALIGIDIMKIAGFYYAPLCDVLGEALLSMRQRRGRDVGLMIDRSNL